MLATALFLLHARRQDLRAMIHVYRYCCPSNSNGWWRVYPFAAALQALRTVLTRQAVSPMMRRRAEAGQFEGAVAAYERWLRHGNALRENSKVLHAPVDSCDQSMTIAKHGTSEPEETGELPEVTAA